MNARKGKEHTQQEKGLMSPSRPFPKHIPFLWGELGPLHN